MIILKEDKRRGHISSGLKKHSFFKERIFIRENVKCSHSGKQFGDSSRSKNSTTI